MPLPMSRERIRKLGVRIASAGVVADDDLLLLEELVACHGEALAHARPRLDGLADGLGMDGPLHVTHRAKTTQTIIEKLRREQGVSLARMQDIAGIQAAWRAAVRREIPAEIRRRNGPSGRSLVCLASISQPPISAGRRYSVELRALPPNLVGAGPCRPAERPRRWCGTFSQGRIR